MTSIEGGAAGTSHSNTATPLSDGQDPQKVFDPEEILRREAEAKAQQKSYIEPSLADPNKLEKEEWKFFTQLTAKVQQTVSTTSEAIAKVVESSVLDNIATQEHEDYDEEEPPPPEEPEDLPRNTKGWVAFELEDTLVGVPGAETNPGIKSPLAPTLSAVPGVVLGEGSNTDDQDAAKTLLDDFGFGSPEPTSTSAAPVSADIDFFGEEPAPQEEELDPDDPFNTSAFDVDKIAEKAAQLAIEKEKQEALQKKLQRNRPQAPVAAAASGPPDEDDPFDTSFVLNSIN